MLARTEFLASWRLLAHPCPGARRRYHSAGLLTARHGQARGLAAPSNHAAAWSSLPPPPSAAAAAACSNVPLLVVSFIRRALTAPRALSGPRSSSLALRIKPREPFLNVAVGRHNGIVLRTMPLLLADSTYRLSDKPRPVAGPWLSRAALRHARSPHCRRAQLDGSTALLACLRPPEGRWTVQGRDHGPGPCRRTDGSLDPSLQDSGGSLTRQPGLGPAGSGEPAGPPAGHLAASCQAPTNQPLRPAACAPGLRKE